MDSSLLLATSSIHSRWRSLLVVENKDEMKAETKANCFCAQVGRPMGWLS